MDKDLGQKADSTKVERCQNRPPQLYLNSGVGSRAPEASPHSCRRWFEDQPLSGHGNERVSEL